MRTHDIYALTTTHIELYLLLTSYLLKFLEFRCLFVGSLYKFTPHQKSQWKHKTSRYSDSELLKTKWA